MLKYFKPSDILGLLFCLVSQMHLYRGIVHFGPALAGPAFPPWSFSKLISIQSEVKDGL